MNLFKEHIVFKLFAFCLAIVLFVPVTVKLIHVFEHHKHIVCNGDNSTHIHQVDVDCYFHDFHLNNNFLSPENTIELFVENCNLPEIISQYHFISDYQRLQFSLRGPPQINLI